VHNEHMHEFRPAEYGPQIQLVCPQSLGRGDRGVHVSDHRAVVFGSQILILPPNSVAWPSRQGVEVGEVVIASNAQVSGKSGKGFEPIQQPRTDSVAYVGFIVVKRGGRGREVAMDSE
jgi:hypothetical protein